MNLGAIFYLNLYFIYINISFFFVIVPFSLLLKLRSHTRGARTVLRPFFFFSFSVRWASSRIIYNMTSLLCFFSLHCLTASLFGPFFHNFDCSKQQYAPGGVGGGGTWVNFDSVCAAGLSDPPL